MEIKYNFPPLSEEQKKKIEGYREKRTKVYKVWVTKVVTKTEWDREYKHLNYYLLGYTPDRKPIIAFLIAKPAWIENWTLPEGVDKLTDEEHFALSQKYPNFEGVKNIEN